MYLTQPDTHAPPPPTRHGGKFPSDLRDWQYLGLATRPEFLVTHRPQDAFPAVALCVRWLSAKGQSGAPSFPVYARVAA